MTTSLLELLIVAKNFRTDRQKKWEDRKADRETERQTYVLER